MEDQIERESDMKELHHLPTSIHHKHHQEEVVDSCQYVHYLERGGEERGGRGEGGEWREECR